MTDYNSLCMNCMNPLLPDRTHCDRCGHDRSAVQTAPYLPLRTVLKNSYLVGTVTSKSNTSITYNGYDTVSGKRIYIHEFFPTNIAFRAEDGRQIFAWEQYSSLYYECLNSFDGLWNHLKTLSGFSSLETPYDIFYLNNTVYSVTEYKQCITVRQYLDSNGQKLTWAQAIEAFMPVFDALEALHESGYIHAGINISTVMIGADRKLHLNAPAIVQSLHVAEVRSVLQDGYAPPECYDGRCQISAETDVYSVMAVMYIIMTGITPQKSTDRLVKDNMVIPRSLASEMPPKGIKTLIRSMKLYPNERIHSIAELKAQIQSSRVPAEQPPVNSVPPAADSGDPEQAQPPVPPFNQSPEDPPSGFAPEKNGKEKADIDSGLSVAVKTAVCALIIGFVVFSTMYTTFLYKSISVPVFDKLYSALPFLPINQDNDHGPTVPQSSAVNNTVAPNTTVPATVAPAPTTAAPVTTTQPTTEPPTTAAPTTTAPPTTAAPTTTEAPTKEALAPGEGVTVADFSKLTYSDIRANAVFNDNFTFEYQFESSETFEKNAVISQSIPAGETVRKGTKIVLVISTGPEKIKLPDVIGMDYEQARITLEKAGFTVKKEIRENDGSETPGKVYMMSLVAGLEFEKGTEVTLVVWGERPLQ